MKIGEYYRRYQKTLSVYILLLLIVVVFYSFIICFPFDKSVAHFLDLTRQVAPLVLMAMGQTVVMLVAGIDLSVGAVASLANILTANFMMGDPAMIPVAIVANLLICALIGFINGVVVVKIKMPPFLVTLAMSSMIRGAYLLYTGGAPKGNIAADFRLIASAWIGEPAGNIPGIFPVAGVMWVAIFAILAFVLYKTRFGRKLYATGGNPRASWLSGISTNAITIGAYMISSTLACISGLMLSALIGVAYLHIGDQYLMNSIAAVCIGGTTFEGGRGGIVGTIAGALIIQVLQSIMTMMGIKEEGSYIIVGALLIIILSVNYFLTRKR